VFTPPTSDDWQVFHGDANPAEARVYVRLKCPPVPGQSLHGLIQGPTSRYARTLTATNRFTARSHGDEWLAEVVLPDPCFWSPELPYLYQVELTLEQDGEAIWKDQRPFGLRRLGVKGRRLYLDGKNWVLRGAAIEDSATFDWQAYRDQDLTLVVNDPGESFCEEADRRGLLIIARIMPHELNLSARLLAWQRHPSVGIAVLPQGLVPPPRIRAAVPNLLFAALIAESSSAVPANFDLMWLEVSGRSDLSLLSAGLSVPAVAVNAAAKISAPEARSACDSLQLRLAPIGEFAGYVA
jgi:hypothetical protein